MHAVTHAIVGASLGGISQNNGAAFLIGLVTHVVLDMTPHYDAGQIPVALADGLVAIGVAAMLLVARKHSDFWGAIGGALPDVEIAATRLTRLNLPRFFPTHGGFLEHGEAGPLYGTLIQVIYIALSLLTAKWFLRRRSQSGNH